MWTTNEPVLANLHTPAPHHSVHTRTTDGRPGLGSPTGYPTPTLACTGWRCIAPAARSDSGACVVSTPAEASPGSLLAVSLEPACSAVAWLEAALVVFRLLPGPRRNSRPGLSRVACAPSLCQPYKNEALLTRLASAAVASSLPLRMTRLTALHRAERRKSVRSADAVVKLLGREPVAMDAPIALATSAAETGQNRPE